MPNLYKKIEYTAIIAPAELGKASVKRYRNRATTGWGEVSGLDWSAIMGVHASIVVGDRLLPSLASLTEAIRSASKPDVDMSRIL